MRSVLFACLLLAVACAVRDLFRAAQQPAEAEAEAAGPKDGRGLIVTLAIVVAATAAARVVLDRYATFDDAFMTFRYARNLAHGYGLVWNRGEAPLEGYTNFLLVAVLAPFVRLGRDPLFVTRALSLCAAVGLGALVFVRNRRALGRGGAIVMGLAYLASNAAFAHAMVGLETVLYTFFLFLGFHFASEHYDRPDMRALARAAVSLLVAVLLRPEAGLLAVLVSVVILNRDRREGHLSAHLVRVGAGFWLPLIVYVGWKIHYFHDVVPNPAHVKILGGGGLIADRGQKTVFDFLFGQQKLLLLAALSIPFARRPDRARVLAGLFVCGYLAFYLHVDTLMDIHNRFLFPLAPFVFELATPALRRGVAFFAARRAGGVRAVWAGIATVVFLFVAYPNPTEAITDVGRAAKRGYDYAPRPDSDLAENGHGYHMRQVGRALGRYPGIEDVTLASVDAGVIAYESRVRHIDMVGLNDRFIARERNVGKLTAYLFGRKPDIILQRDRADGSLITYGHGVLGDHTAWAEHPGWDDYGYAGSIIDMEPWRHELHVFVRHDAPASLLTYVQRRVVDVVHAQPPVVYGTARAEARLRAASQARRRADQLAPQFPLAVSPDRRYLVDASGAPFLVQGDAAWSLVTRLGDDDVHAYLADRAARGFNAAIVTLIDHAKGPEAKPDATGQKPFVTAGDFATPNPAYFDNARRRIAAARDAGFAVFLAPAYLGYNGGDEGFYAVMVANGAEKLRGYGRYVGERFKDLDNIVWVEGGDYSPPAEGLALVNAIAEGIRDAGAHQLQTAHWSPETSASELPTTGWLDLDSTYTYEPVYVKSARDHGADAGKRPHLLIESTYENEHASTTEMLRAQAYTALLAGAAGQFFGNSPVWKFEGSWREALESPGSRSMAQLAALFRQLPWWTLEPDDRALTFVSGLGPYGGRDRVVGARSVDGRVAIAYIPGARQEKPIAVNLARLAGPVRACFYDPERGVFKDSDENPVPNGGVRSFTAPESPAGRQAGDWVLLLEAL